MYRCTQECLVLLTAKSNPATIVKGISAGYDLLQSNKHMSHRGVSHL